MALLCYNQLVGDWMRQRIAEMDPMLPNLVIGRAIRVMAEMANVALPETPPPAFWEIELPQQIEERLTDPDLETASLYDYMVLDEAQDLLAQPRLSQCLTQFLRGGIDGGTFALSGDFNYQMFAAREQMDSTLCAIEVSTRPAQWHLYENCRNYQIIGYTVLRLGSICASVYSDYFRSGGGLQNFRIFFYENNEEQLMQIKQWLRDFKTVGFRASEITLLSFHADKSFAAATQKSTGFKLHPAWQSGKGTVYSSVQAVKGIENKIIILSDVVLSDHCFHRDLYYAGMTSATECARILCDRKTETALCGWLTGKAEI